LWFLFVSYKVLGNSTDVFAQVDLDCSALVFDDCGVLVDACYYNHLEAYFGALVHSGDNRDGLSDGVDERITLHLSKFPPNVSFLVFAVNAFQGGNLKDVETANAVFLNDRGERLTSVSATCSGSANQENTCILLCMMQASRPSISSVPIRIGNLARAIACNWKWKFGSDP
jgi:stress response protein SCP2